MSITRGTREGQPNPDTAIVEAALERVPLPDIEAERAVWYSIHRAGQTAGGLSDSMEIRYPAFAQALREGIAARRGQRHGGHGGKG